MVVPVRGVCCKNQNNNRLQDRSFQFCTQGIVIYIFSTDQKSKIFSLLIKNLSLRSWRNQGALHVSCHGKAFF